MAHTSSLSLVRRSTKCKFRVGYFSSQKFEPIQPTQLFLFWQFLQKHGIICSLKRIIGVIHFVPKGPNFLESFKDKNV